MNLINQFKIIAPQTINNTIESYRRHKDIYLHRHMSQSQVENCLREKYRESIGLELNLEEPKRFTEKMQWCKLHAMDSEKSILADKYAVREWVGNLVGNEHLVPLLGAWEDPYDIDFTTLPDSLVLKTNNASATNIIITDKSTINERRLRRQMRNWLDEQYGWISFEPQYFAIEPKIIAEKYLHNDDGSEIKDYKFLCFDGEPYFVWVDFNRHSEHTRIIKDIEWNDQIWSFNNYPKPSFDIDKPVSYEEMLRVTRQLAAGFPHVRVDLYELNGCVLFGEMTFTSASGFGPIRPVEWDYRLGNMWDLHKEKRAEFPYGA